MLLLLLLPITFDFWGTIDTTPKEQYIQGVTVEVGQPFSGSFTFERDEFGEVSGEVTFNYGGLDWQSWYVSEQTYGLGFLTAVTTEAVCSARRPGLYPCMALISFRPPRETGGGDGTRNHFMGIFAMSDHWIFGSLAHSRNVQISPYLPFAVRDAYFVPEPGTLVLVGAGLLGLCWKLRRG